MPDLYRALMAFFSQVILGDCNIVWTYEESGELKICLLLLVLDGQSGNNGRLEKIPKSSAPCSAFQLNGCNSTYVSLCRQRPCHWPFIVRCYRL